jgi:hypothetical protein
LELAQAYYYAGGVMISFLQPFDKTKVKVLSLPNSISDDSGCVEGWNWRKNFKDTDQIHPIFNRVGWYYSRHLKVSWIEFEGEAWLMRTEDFLFRLEQLDHIPLTMEEVKAYKVLRKHKRIPRKEYQKLYRRDYYWKEIHGAYWGARHWSERVLSAP